MHSVNGIQKNIEMIGKLFPDVITEVECDGEVKYAIDFDALRDNLSEEIVEGNEERYQFTWPDKKKAKLLANTPISATLRPVREESVNFDTTENLYIEGDNLDVLKLLQETYLGKVKMIYIDPPYNRGNDFIYEDDFSQDVETYKKNSGQFDEQANRLDENLENNGRFHTDWLNMLYPRLKLARNLLKNDGVIFISIDDHEIENLKKICDELYGIKNFIAIFPWRKRTAKSDVPYGISQDYEWVLSYAKSTEFLARIQGNDRKYFTTMDFPDRPWRIHDLTKQTTASERPNSFFTIINPKNENQYPANPNRTWAITKETFERYLSEDRIVFPGDYPFLNISKPALRYWKEDDQRKSGDMFGMISVSTKLPESVGMSLDGTKEITGLFGRKIFNFPKTVSLIKFFVDISTKNDPTAIILDFFSGSATTANAIMRFNLEEKCNIKYIMIQIPENTVEKSEAYKVGFKNICDIGKERIRRAAKKIHEEYPDVQFDDGFRVLRLDDSNMKDVYYNPQDTSQDMFANVVDNVKEDRSPEDLLFQVMLELDTLLSSKIETIEICDKRVFNVADGYLMACFDKNVTAEVVTEIAKKKPYYAVFRDASLADDSVATNFDQIFETYSKDTIRKVL